MSPEMSDGGMAAKEIYDLVNQLNEAVERAARLYRFTIVWDIIRIEQIGSRPYPHLDMTVLTPVKY